MWHPNSDDEDYSEQRAISTPNTKLQDSEHSATWRPRRRRSSPSDRRQRKLRTRYSRNIQCRKHSPSLPSDKVERTDNQSYRAVSDDELENQDTDVELVQRPNVSSTFKRDDHKRRRSSSPSTLESGDSIYSDSEQTSEYCEDDRSDAPSRRKRILLGSAPKKEKKGRRGPPQKGRHAMFHKDDDSEYSYEEPSSSDD